MPLEEIDEGGFTVSVPEESYFRFEDCPTYDRIGSHGVTEVDFGWKEEGADQLWLMELKNYGPKGGELHQDIDQLREELPKNLVHSFLLIATVWADTALGRKLRSELEQTCPDFPEDSCSVRTVLIVRTQSIADRVYLPSLETAIQEAVDVVEFDDVLVLDAADDRIEADLGIQITEANA